MSTEETQEKGAQSAPQTQQQETAKAAAEQQAAPPPAAKSTPEPQQGSAEPAKEAKRHRASDKDEIPADADLIEMSKKALDARIDRARKSELKARFGTDDPDEIKAKLDRLAQFEKEREEQRRAAMDEKARLDEDLKKANLRAEAAERALEEAKTSRMVEGEDRRLTKMGERYIDPDYVEDQLPSLARAIRREFTEKQIDAGKVTDKWIEDWWKQRAKDKPKLAKDFEESAKEPRKVPLTNGPSPNARPDRVGGPGGPGGEKTAKPGQANSMSPQELRDYKKSLGLNY